jgi:uncharacterized membrane protein
VFPASPAWRRLAAVSIVVASLTWLVVLWAATTVSPGSGKAAATASAAVYVMGSFLCHQRPERSFHLNGVQLPVCARCLGLYAGGFAGAAAWSIVMLLRKTSRAPLDWTTSTHVVRSTLAVAAAPTLVSAALGLSGLADGTNALRAMLALPLGMAIGATVTAVTAGHLR